MKERTWHKGPPPHVGWWNASVIRDKYMWRWWDGAFWGNAVHKQHEANRAALLGSCVYRSEQREIWWSDYYPKNARVPRINPETRA